MGRILKRPAPGSKSPHPGSGRLADRIFRMSSPESPTDVPDLSKPEPEDQALRRLMLFQFAVLSGLFALGLPGLFVVGKVDQLHSLYYPVVGIHLFFLWRLYRFDPAMLPWVQGFLLVVVVLPWCIWALGRFLGIDWYLSAPTLFVIFVLFTLWRAFPRIDAPPAD